MMTLSMNTRHILPPQVYGLPFGMTKHFQARVGDPLRAKLSGASGPVLPKWRAAKRSVARAVTCCGFIGPVHEEKDLTVRPSTAVNMTCLLCK